MNNVVLVDTVDGVMTISINRPEKKNSLSREAYGLMADALEQAEKDDAVRAVLWTAEGDIFSAGVDMSELGSADPDAPVSGPSNNERWMSALGRIEKPVIAAVPGAAIGIGATMLMHVDLICIAEEGSLRTPFANLALSPEASSSYLIADRIGYSRAYAMFALGEPIPGAKAVEWGLAHVCVPRSELRETAVALATTLAEKAPGSLKAVKRLLRAPHTEAVQTAAELESKELGDRLRSAETTEAFKAFAEKRKPNYAGLS